MKKINQYSLIAQAIIVYLLSLVVSSIFSPLFGKLYILIFSPPNFGGGFFFTINDPNAILDGIFFGFFFFLPFFIFWLIKKRQWLIWFIGAIFPLSIAVIGGGLKDTAWALILTFAGWLLAQSILRFKK